MCTELITELYISSDLCAQLSVQSVIIIGMSSKLHSPECAYEAGETSLDKERHLVTNMEVGILAIGTELLLKRSLHARHSWLQAQPTTSQASQAAGRVQKYSKLIAREYSECTQSVLTTWRPILHAWAEAEIQILSIPHPRIFSQPLIWFPYHIPPAKKRTLTAHGHVHYTRRRNRSERYVERLCLANLTRSWWISYEHEGRGLKLRVSCIHHISLLTLILCAYYTQYCLAAEESQDLFLQHQRRVSLLLLSSIITVKALTGLSQELKNYDGAFWMLY